MHIVDTLQFFPTKVPLPQVSPTDAILHAAQDLIHALCNTQPFTPLLHLGEPKQRAIQELTCILNEAALRVDPGDTSHPDLT